jgi:hypothetical protein
MMAVYQPSTIHAEPASMSLSNQPMNSMTITAQALALQKLGRSINMDVFQELIDLDTPSELFSKDIVSEYLVMAPMTLGTMNDSLYVSSSPQHLLLLTFCFFQYTRESVTTSHKYTISSLCVHGLGPHTHREGMCSH